MPPGLLLDTTDDFSYVFYMSSFFLISAALFMGGSFCVLGKKERQGPWAEAKELSQKLPRSRASPQRIWMVLRSGCVSRSCM